MLKMQTTGFTMETASSGGNFFYSMLIFCCFQEHHLMELGLWYLTQQCIRYGY